MPAAGKVRGALRFDGSNYVAVADSDLWAFGTKDFTIELWANWDVPGSGSIGEPGDIFIGNDEGPGTRNKWFFALGGGVLEFVFSSPTIGDQFLTFAPFTPNLNQWYHLAIRRQGNTFTAFVNGLPSSSVINTAAIPNSNAPLTIGQAENIGFMNGRLDEIAIYNRALTQEELKAIYDAGSAGKCINLSIRPDKGGDTGSVSVHINGTGFAQGATVKLVRAGQPDIAGNNVTVADNGTTIDTTFNLMGKVRGIWDVVVTNPDSPSIVLAQGFTIEPGQVPQLWVDVVGLNLIRPGRPQNYWLSYGNKGNIDLQGSHIFLHISSPLSYKFGQSANFISPMVPTKVQWLLPSVPTASPRVIPLMVSAPTLGVATDIEVAASGNSQGFADHIESFSPGNQNSLISPSTFLLKRFATFQGVEDSTTYSQCKKEPWDGNVPDGYTDFLKISDITQPIGKRLERYIAARLDGNLVLNYRGLNVIKIPFQDVINGMTTLSDGTVVSRVQLSDGRLIVIKHTGSIRTASPGEMPEVVARMKRNLPRLEGRVTFCAWGKNDNPNNCGGFHTSCLGFHDLLRYWDGEVTPDGRPMYTVPWGEEGCNGGRCRIEDLRSKWANECKDDDPMLHDKMPDQDVNPPWFPWWEANKVTRPLLTVSSFDPNDKVGSQGAGEKHFLSGEEPLRYTVFFENLETATAPAQEVVITDQLDKVNMDLSTLSLGPIAFGNKQVTPPPGTSAFATDVDLRPDKNLIVRITAGLNPNTGLLTWRLTSIDPATGNLPADPRVGFLPPSVNPPEGNGSVLFTVMPKKGLSTGTQIRNQARIIFDTNAPIDTPQWFNTLDNTKPMSNVLPLSPTQSSASFNVQWQGTDVGSGVRNYTIFVSENGGLFTPWLSNTSATSVIFTGQSGKTYGFYSVAQDQTGNREDPPNAADATTQVVAGANLVITKTASPNPILTGSNLTYTITVTNNGPGAAANVTVTDNLPASTTFVSCFSTGGGVCGGSGNNRTVTFTSLASGASATITLVANVNCSLANGSAISNTATVSSSTPDPDTNNNSATANVAASNPPPVIANPSANPSVLWPPNHKMVNVTVNYSVTDNCGPVTCVLSVSSNEPINGTGDGDTAPDWEIVDANHVRLRAERAGNGAGRIYTITITCRDSAGNSSSKSVTVRVPISQGQN